MYESLAFIPGMSGAPEIILVVLVILLLFGGKRIPELARSLGKSLSEFKKGQQEGTMPDPKLDQSKQKEMNDANFKESADKKE